MKRFLITIFLVVSAIGVYAQNATINKLKLRLHAAKNDSTKLLILDSLSMYNMFFYHGSDSTLNYCNDYINTAFRLPDKKYIILAYSRLSFYYSNVAQYKESLSAALKGLNLAEQYHNRDYLSALYYDLTWAYSSLNDNTEALKNARRGISYLRRDKDPFFDEALHLYGITGLCYQDLGKADSAVFYYRKMNSVVSASKELSAKAVADFHWTFYYLFDTKQYEKADSYIADGIKECLTTGNFLLNTFYSYSANSAIGQRKFDKAILQATAGYKFSILINDPSGQMYAASLLESAYETLKKRDSAFRYLKYKIV